MVDSPYDYNATVTVKLNNGTGTNPGFTKTGYDFQNWNTAANGSGTSYDPADNEHNTFSITANTNLFAQWQAHPYSLNKAEMTNGNVSFKVNTTTVTQATIGQTVTIVVAPASGYKLSTLTVTNDATSETVTVTKSTFTMPASSVTVSATFEVYYAYVIDFENAANTYTVWEFSTMNSQQTTTITAHGGTYYGTTNGGNPAYIVTKNKITNPQSITCYVTRQSTNDTGSTWAIQVSSNGSLWTTVGDTQSAVSMAKGTWVEVTRDLSSYNNVYVRVYYSGSTAVRNIDDLSLEYIPSEYAVTLSSVSGGTISASDGTTTITSGSANFETGKTITLTAEGDATHMFSSWNVTETVSGDEVEVIDNSFEMPACAVTVSATFVESWTFTYNINGHVVTEKYPRDNESKSLISTSEYFPEGFSLRGWTEDESDVSDPKISATASQNRTFYAVFGKNVYGDFVKVESSQSDWSGNYLIVYESGSVALDGSKTGSNLDATPNSFAVSISSKTIEYNSTTEAAMFTIAKNGDYYTICSASGYYIGRTANSNGFDYSTNTKYNHTIAYNSGVTVTSSAGPKLQYFNSGNNSKFRYYSSSQTAIALYKSGLSLEGSYTNVIPSDEVATDDILITSPTIIPAGSILNMGDHELSIGAGGSLVIEDGGQLICNNSVAATVKKKIEAPTPAASKDGDVYGWYTISSPVHTGSNAYVTIGDETTVNLTTGSYDMFAYNEATQKWINRKSGSGASGFNEMYKGQGYIYRNSGNELSFVGNTNVGDIDYHQTLTITGSGDLAGFNLIGNPYTHSITKGSGKAIYNTNFSSGFYVLEDDAWVPYNDGDEIKAKQGILIKTNAEVSGFQIKDVNYVAPAKYNGDNIKFIVSNGQFKDVAYALFDKGIGLDKINHRSPDVPMLYINQDGLDYAIATMSDDTKTFNLNFKAGTMSKYTLSFNANDHFNYLHLIDLLTGEDVDMLLEKEYSFIATPNDKDNRFIVKLGYNPNNEPSSDDIFAYQSGSEIYVTGNGELQIFDITGRSVMTTTINGAESISISAQGVYIFKLNEKVQKIVVR